VHFGPNTFSGKEWGTGQEDPAIFNPTDFDARQWVQAFREAGMTKVILTAKHHDGFCLWPSRFSTHTVAKSPWQGGKGDVVKEVAEACREFGLKFGVYLSPWDRHHPAFGTPQYNDVFVGQLEEVLRGYGPVHEVWFDGANGEGPNGKRQEYDLERFRSTVRRWAPEAVIFGDAQDVRWVGNEAGWAAPTTWYMLDRARYGMGTPLYAELAEGSENGPDWCPPEVDVSIRPGWFYRPEEDARVRSVDNLERIYYESVGRGANLLLNVPPDRRGRLAEPDVAALSALGRRLRQTFGEDLAAGAPVVSRPQGREEHPASLVTDATDETFWAAPEAERSAVLDVMLPPKTTFDRVEFGEPIRYGQRIRRWVLEALVGQEWQVLERGTTVGQQRIVPIAPVEASRVRLRIVDSRAAPLVTHLRVHKSPAGSYAWESTTQRDRRMAWWREARFGMFIHWGLYAIPAGTWQGKTYGGASEWLLNSARVPPAEWLPLIKQFNPTEFNARAWVRLAKRAGMKYIVITSKHHEGFALWPSRQGDFDVANTPFRRDILRELANACRAEGIRLGFYHSILDWTHPDYQPRREWDTRPLPPPDYERYVQRMKAQLRELLTEYGDVAVVWFDGEWEPTWTHERGKDLYEFVRQLQPRTIINNRVDVGRQGMSGFSAAEFRGDFGTPEQEIPAGGIPNVDWESCMTMNDSWGYHAGDQNWKSTSQLLRNLLECASKGGNYLLNVGPDARGRIPEPSERRLTEMGEWLRRNGESVYGTSAGPFTRALPWGLVTRKNLRLYLAITDPRATELQLPGLQNRPLQVHWLGRPGVPLPVRSAADGPAVSLGRAAGPGMPVVVMDFAEPPRVERVLPRPAADGCLELAAEDATVQGHTARYEREKRAIGFWTRREDVVQWEFEAVRGEFLVELELACTPEATGSVFTVSAFGQTLRGTVPDTGGWDRFTTISLGKLIVVAPGRAVLRVSAETMPKGAVMNLRAVRLRPQ
jgi:alpha-L-fucosidase